MQNSNIYTVESLLERLAIKSTIKVWQSLRESNIQIKGTVTQVRNYRDHLAFIDLEGSGLKLTLKCPFELRPAEGENIVFSGQVIIQPSKFNTGFEPIIVGEPIGKWQPKKFTSSVKLPSKNVRTLLSDYLNESPAEELLVLGSDTGLRDVKANISLPSLTSQMNFVRINVSDRDIMLLDIKNSIDKYEPYAFAIIRGGDDSTLNIWDDPYLIKELVNTKCPFYLALGHTHRVTLADKYADETFHTPSSFGSTFKRHIHKILQEEATEEKISNLLDELKMEKNRVSRIKYWFQNALWILLTTVILQAAYIYFYGQNINNIFN